MKVLKFSFLGIVGSFALGILCSSFFGLFSIIILLFISIFFLFIFQLCKVVFYFKFPSLSIWYYFIATISFFFLGAFTDSIHKTTLLRYHYSERFIDDSQHKIKYILTKELKKTFTSRQRFYAEIKGIDGVLSTGKILVSVTDTTLVPKVGQEWVTFQKIRNISPSQSLGQFDYASYLKTQDVYGQIYLDMHSSLYLGEVENLKFKLFQLRLNLINKVKTAFKNNEASYLAVALLFGERKDIDNTILEDFKRTGVMHVLAISGLHVGILFLLLRTLFKMFPLFLKTTLIIILLWIFVFLSGFSPSVFRAVLMFSIITLASLLRRPHSMFNTIGFAMLISLCIRPIWIYDVGFQLSYAAVFSIVFFNPILTRYTFSKSKLLKYIKELIAISISAQIGVLPFLIYYFHQFPIFFILGNLIAVPSVMILLFIAFFILFFIYLWFDLSVFLGHFFSFFSNLLFEGIGFINNFSFIVLDDIPFHISLLFSTLLFIYCFGFFIKKKTLNLLYVFLCGLLIFQINLFSVNYFYLKKHVLILSNHNKEPVLLHKKGDSFLIYAFTDSLNTESIAKSFKLITWSNNITHKKLFREFQWNDKKVLIVDNEACVNIDKKYDVLVISGDLKINYDRLFVNLDPNQVVIHNTVPNWLRNSIKEVCVKKEIPFHDSYEKGFYKF